ncbi:MAG TPA: LysR family transcriptional regulator [Steroidobacter sp.]|uniref:LysR family transcriptional regulator n=1 Tax=Steroidobacter sp. TaxID=1978227 RepID=UPI002EDA6270
MQLSRIDLNLFTVFDAIYREGGITPASRRLHLSQPAVSHALGRLRELLNDPLFERRGHEMIPTPLARSLADSIASSLGGLEQMLQRVGHFEPGTAQRCFTIAARESHELAFLPELMCRLGSEASHVHVASVRIDRRDLEEDLQSGEIDVALDVALPLSSEVRRELISTEPLVVLARADHPVVQGKLDIETYLALSHVLVTGRRRGGGYEDAALARLGLSRHIKVRCQQHAAASQVVSRSDLLVTLTRSQALFANRQTGNQLLPFPIEVPPLESFLYWHSNVDEDPASQWFRAQLRACLTSGWRLVVSGQSE